MDLVTWADLQAALNLIDSQQTEATRLIGVASARARQYTGRELLASDRTLEVDGSGKALLTLPDYPINSVTSVHVDRTRVFAAESAITDYSVISDLGQLHRLAGWRRGEQNVRVVANLGHQTLPADLTESIYQCVDYWLNNGGIRLAQSTGSEGMIQSLYVGVLDVPYQVRSVWDQHRNWNVA